MGAEEEKLPQRVFIQSTENESNGMHTHTHLTVCTTLDEKVSMYTHIDTHTHAYNSVLMKNCNS